MQHRSKDAYLDGMKVPTDDQDKQRCQSGSGRQLVDKDRHCRAIHQGMQLPKWGRSEDQLRLN